MNMSHEEIRELLPDFVKGTLAPDAEGIVRKHLDGCPECRKEAGLIREMLDMAVPDPGEEFWNALPSVARADERPERKPAVNPFRALTALVVQLLQPLPAAAVAALAVLVLVVSTGLRQDAPDLFSRNTSTLTALDYDELEESDVPAVAIDVQDAEVYLQSGRFGSVSYVREFASMDKEELAELEKILMKKNQEGG